MIGGLLLKFWSYTILYFIEIFSEKYINYLMFNNYIVAKIYTKVSTSIKTKINSAKISFNFNNYFR